MTCRFTYGCQGAADTIAKLHAALRRFRYEDCPECYARAEMLADVTPLSPGSQNVMVVPTGWKMTHHQGCKLGALMATLEPSEGPKRAPRT